MSFVAYVTAFSPLCVIGYDSLNAAEQSCPGVVVGTTRRLVVSAQLWHFQRLLFLNFSESGKKLQSLF